MQRWTIAMSAVMMKDWWAAVEAAEMKMDDDEMWVLTDVDGGVAVSLNGNDAVLVTAMLAGGDADGMLDAMAGRCSHRVRIDNSFDTVETVRRAMAAAGGVRAYKVAG
jgi:hypothetical protein